MKVIRNMHLQLKYDAFLLILPFRLTEAGQNVKTPRMPLQMIQCYQSNEFGKKSAL
jgi:hypothetical protein